MSNQHVTELKRLLAEFGEQDHADAVALRAENQALRNALAKAEAEAVTYRVAFNDATRTAMVVSE